MTDKVYPYHAAAQLDDGTELLLDLEEHGWAAKEIMDHTVRFTLIPKPGVTGMPVVTVAIPKGAKPIFMSRAFGKLGMAEASVKFRCYALGYKLGRTKYLAWVLPSGAVEIGPDPLIADQLIDQF